MGTRQLESLRIEVTGLRGDDEQAPRILRVSYYRTVLIFRVTDQDLSSSRPGGRSASSRIRGGVAEDGADPAEPALYGGPGHHRPFG